MTISAIYLAAGFSKRFGENKLLHEIGGKPMYQYTLGKLISILQETALISQVIVVTQYDEIEQYIVQQNTLLQEVVKDNANEIQVVRNMHSERG
ncbi:MAG TPA: NTP transferase domain-containing protein, partial [Lachnospiraceae bacterium]|nr:NTP transferase domain-containing protein [Lachnospiraceae bacterium]